jgi:hypothetical protein
VPLPQQAPAVDGQVTRVGKPATRPRPAVGQALDPGPVALRFPGADLESEMEYAMWRRDWGKWPCVELCQDASPIGMGSRIHLSYHARVS